jgi:hypothetical protein
MLQQAGRAAGEITARRLFCCSAASSRVGKHRSKGGRAGRRWQAAGSLGRRSVVGVSGGLYCITVLLVLRGLPLYTLLHTALTDIC